jgi:hypothetical protein
MTRKFSYITGVAGVALVLAAPAFGKSQPVVPQWQQALEARSQQLNRNFGLGDFAKNNTWQATSVSTYRDAGERSSVPTQPPAVATYRDAGERVGAKSGGELQYLAALEARSRELNRIHRLGEFAPTQIDPQFLAAMQARSEALNRKNGLGSYGPIGVSDTDRSFVDNPSTPATPVSVTSGSEIEWPQVGIALGIGIVLVIGLGLALRMRRPPLAH